MMNDDHEVRDAPVGCATMMSHTDVVEERPSEWRKREIRLGEGLEGKV